MLPGGRASKNPRAAIPRSIRHGFKGAASGVRAEPQTRRLWQEMDGRPAVSRRSLPLSREGAASPSCVYFSSRTKGVPINFH